MAAHQPRRAIPRPATAVAALMVVSVGIATAAMPTSAAPRAAAHSLRVGPTSRQTSKRATSMAVLAHRITGKNLHVGVGAVQEVLARSGIATREGKHTYRRAVAPAASSTATRYETINLALDARNPASGSSTTLADLGRTLLRFHAFKRLGRNPAVAMRDFMTTWVRAARRIPHHPQSFAPLFLATLAKRQQPSINLAAGTYNPATFRLSLLDLEIICAAFDRFPPKDRHPLKPSKEMHGTLGTPQQPMVASDSPGNCAEVLKEYIGKVVPGYDQIESSAIQAIGSEAIAAAIAKLTTGKASVAVFESHKAAFGGILSIVNTLMRLQKLAALYKGVQIKVDVFTTPIEKPEAQQNYVAGQPQYGDGQFAAVVGLTPEAEKQYQGEVDNLGSSFRTARKAIQDCASVVGLPVPAFSDDVAEDLTLFKVKWALEASPDTARYEFKKTVWFAPGGRLGALTRISDTQAAHVMHVDIPSQPPWSYAPNRFHKVSAYANATAELITAQPPTLGTLINGMLGPLAPFGLVDALVELSVGWFQSLATPEATDQMEVTEHKPLCIVGHSSSSRAGHLLGAASADQCTGRYGGTFSGTADLSTGPAPVPLNATYYGTVVLKGNPSGLPPGFGLPDFYYYVESGSMHFRISGTLANGCDLLAEGPVDLGADPNASVVPALNQYSGSPTKYTLTLSPPLAATVPGAFSDCANPADDMSTDWPVSTGVAALIESPPKKALGKDGTVAGTNSGRSDASVPTQTWAWNLRPL